MNNNSSQLNGFNSRVTGDYLDELLHGPHSSAIMETELKKINAHVVQEETMMKNILASVGVALLLGVITCLFYLPGILQGSASIFSK